MTDAISDIAAERQRQIDREGWTHGHDDRHHEADELATAAACYAAPHSVDWPLPDDDRRGTSRRYANVLRWPWDRDWWKPGGESGPVDRRRQLVKAGALIVAEIERLDRKDVSHD